MPVFLSPEFGKNPERLILFPANKYNPSYNLGMMNPKRLIDKVRTRGNMADKKDEPRKENQGKLSTGSHGSYFEIQVKGHLDNSWSDWLGGLEVKLLDNGEMTLYGHIGDQAALMGILNKLYGLNLPLLSVSEVGKKK
jgi:hypothetical protein